MWLPGTDYSDLVACILITIIVLFQTIIVIGCVKNWLPQNTTKTSGHTDLASIGVSDVC